MKPENNIPPQIFLRLFRWFCHPDFREEIEGDLFEQYERNTRQFGRQKANRFFIKEVVLLFKPALIGNINHLTNIHSTIMLTKSKSLITIVATVAGLLSIPLIAMQFNNGVNWSLSDFIIMGGLLLLTGLTIDFVWRKITSTRNRLIVLGIVLLTFLLIWAELAVGIFGTPFAGQ